MADYQEPSLVGTDPQTLHEYVASGAAVYRVEPGTWARYQEWLKDVDPGDAHLVMRIHGLLDRAGIETGGSLMDRVALVLVQRDNYHQRLIDTERRLNSPQEADADPGPGEVAVPEEGYDRVEALRVALTNWWIDLAHEEVERVVPKAVEYGATDLAEIGRTLAQTMGWDGLDNEAYTELGIYFYLVGKVARWTDAVKTRRSVSDDTLHDIGVYVRMAQRNRAVGGWPVPTEELFDA